MSVNIDTALVKGFERGVTLLAQQEGSRLRECVDVRMVGPGEEFSFDQLGTAEPAELTTRHADTPISDIAHDRRWVTPKTFARAELIDKPDALKTINDFTNPYLRAIAMGFGRQMDREIITAALATARTGKASSTSTESFDTTNCRIAHGSVGLTLIKINQAAKILRTYEHPKPWYMVVAADQIEDVMNDSTITSADYNAVRALMQGEIDTFGGFTWRTTQLLSKSSTTRSCLAWSKMSMLLAFLEQPFSRISERDDKNYTTQVYYRSLFGSTRMQYRGVVEVQCTE
jgi:hypothetical protein